MPSRFESSQRRSSIGQSQRDSSRPAAVCEPATLPLSAAANSAVLLSGVILWSLAAFEHAVIPHDANSAQSSTFCQFRCGLEGLGGAVIAPGREQDDIAGCQHGI